MRARVSLVLAIVSRSAKKKKKKKKKHLRLLHSNNNFFFFFLTRRRQTVSWNPRLAHRSTRIPVGRSEARWAESWTTSSVQTSRRLDPLRERERKRRISVARVTVGWKHFEQLWLVPSISTFQRSRVVLSVGNNLWKRVGQKFSRRSLGSRLKGSIFFFLFCRYFIGITKGSIGRMKGVTRFECCSCWPEMIDRGALLAGTDLPLPVALPLLPRTGSWQLETPRYFFFAKRWLFLYRMEFLGHRFCYCACWNKSNKLIIL